MIIQKKELSTILQALKPGLAKKEIIQEFTHYIFTGEDIITFNDEICISHPFKTEFNCSVRAEELFKTISGIREETLEITVEKSMDIKSSKTRASLSVSPDERAKELISVLNLKEVPSLMNPLPADFIRGMFLCMFSASKDMTKGIFTCVRLSGDFLCSTDGIRISKYQLSKDIEAKTLIPAHNVQELVKFPITQYGLVESWAHFMTDEGVIFSSRIMEGDYPSLDQYFEFEGQKVKLPSDLKGLVESVSFMTEGKVDRDKMIVLVVSNDKITCKGAKKHIGWIERDIDFKYIKEDFEVQINPFFLNEVLEKATVMKVAKEAAMFSSGSFQHVIALQ